MIIALIYYTGFPTSIERSHSKSPYANHNLARFSYTTYDVWRSQDVINPRTPHCNIMLLNKRDGGEYCYAKVIGIHYVNVVRLAYVYKSHWITFLFIWWYKPVQDYAWDTCTLGHIHFQPLANENVFGFIDPGVVLRACHIISVFSWHPCNPDECIISLLAGDKHDWHGCYVNRWMNSDHLMIMIANTKSTTALLIAILLCAFTIDFG